MRGRSAVISPLRIITLFGIYALCGIAFVLRPFHLDTAWTAARNNTFLLHTRSDRLWLAAAPSKDNATQLFDWTAYLDYNTDLRPAGITDQVSAYDHWINHGKSEGRSDARPNITVRYTTCGGLINQQYCHISAFWLARRLNATKLVFPPSISRNSFDVHFNMDKAHNDMKWTVQSASSMYDVRAIQQHWRDAVPPMQIQIPLLLDPTDYEVPATAYIHSFTTSRIAQVDGVYRTISDPDDLILKVRSAVGAVLRDSGERGDVDVLVDLPCTFFMLNTTTILPEVNEVAQSLSFNSKLVQLASDIRKRMPQTYNAVHLRIETDAGPWISTLGGHEAYWNRYKNAMRVAGLDNQTALYVATGLLSYDKGRAEFEGLHKDILASGLAISVIHKHMFAAAGLQDLNPEQLALIDLMLLSQAHSFVGIGVSTYSYYVCELRRLGNVYSMFHMPGNSAGMMNDTLCVLVGASEIGTDDMFKHAARVY